MFDDLVTMICMELVCFAMMKLSGHLKLLYFMDIY